MRAVWLTPWSSTVSKRRPSACTASNLARASGSVLPTRNVTRRLSGARRTAIPSDAESASSAKSSRRTMGAGALAPAAAGATTVRDSRSAALVSVQTACCARAQQSTPRAAVAATLVILNIPHSLLWWQCVRRPPCGAPPGPRDGGNPTYIPSKALLVRQARGPIRQPGTVFPLVRSCLQQRPRSTFETGTSHVLRELLGDPLHQGSIWPPCLDLDVPGKPAARRSVGFHRMQEQALPAHVVASPDLEASNCFAANGLAPSSWCRDPDPQSDHERQPAVCGGQCAAAPDPKLATAPPRLS